MKILNYIKDKGIFLSINLLIFIITAFIMYLINTSVVIIFSVFCIWFFPLLSYMLIEFFKYKRYFNSVKNILENLDKKYLLPEVIDDPNFIEGIQMNNIFKILSRDMHEHVKYYRVMQEEYREYIEMWVHEIKTPMASSKLLIENNNNDITRKINTQLDRIENFVEQVLYYSRSDEVGKDYIIKKVELSTVVKSVINKNKRDFINKRIRLQLDDINETIYTDVKWVEFILNQIIGNSIKYSKLEDAKISISSKKVDNSIVLIIEDNGVGIIEKDVNKVFEKGFTGENGRKFGKSTGIGLYLCKKLCDKLGLGLNLKSTVNEGTSLSIVFPIYENLTN
ncbi:sensor histidine kinase [Romboutsia sp. 1001713B170207_170306_H8]|uniref:sensor histidine kinase n=1 Tax=Romboutsia sp. 1001713B170207_170306_H8 TaxID=2787112 RepID=UPI000821BB3C|nr:sensor histidine kinase [Romboutsia sp. 1001713B170207_170306_H8]SCG99779.1 Sensor histidine kinase graS [uncultured Clostridium sp.]